MTKYYVQRGQTAWACYAPNEAAARGAIRRVSNNCDWVLVATDRTTLRIVSKEEAYRAQYIREVDGLDVNDPQTSSAIADGRIICSATDAADYAPSGTRLFLCCRPATRVVDGRPFCEKHTPAAQ